MDTQTLQQAPNSPPNRRKWTIVAVAVTVVLAIVAGVVTAIIVRSGDDDGRSGPTASPTPSASSSPSSSPSPSPTATATPDGTATPSVPPITPRFAFQPLWPFAGPADAAVWQQRYRSGGHQPWHLDPALTALSFTQGYLGYRDVDQVVSIRILGTEAWIGVGNSPQPGPTSTAALLHLARIGSGSDAPWEVVGTRDTTLSLTTPTYGAKVRSPVTVGGRVTGVDVRCPEFSGQWPQVELG